MCTFADLKGMTISKALFFMKFTCTNKNGHFVNEAGTSVFFVRVINASHTDKFTF